MNTTYTYDEVLEILNGEKNVGGLCFKDVQEKYSLSYCYDNKIKWCRTNQGHYKEEYSYSNEVKDYIKNAQFRKYTGYYPFEKLA